MTWHQEILQLTLRENINDFVHTKVPCSDVNLDNTKSKWRYDHRSHLMQFKKHKRSPKIKSPELQ